MHASYVRRVASFLDDQPELQAQLETLSDADEDEWLSDERTPHAQVEPEEPEVWEPEEPEVWEPEEAAATATGASAGASAAGASAADPSGAADDGEEDDEEDEDWSHLEVPSSALAESHPTWAGIVGLDVCVLAAAFPAQRRRSCRPTRWAGARKLRRSARARRRAASRSR